MSATLGSSDIGQRSKTYFFLALATLATSMVLVTLGGVVHNTDSSLACPDWPLCFGQVFPEMKGAVAIEHSHRLLATLVGILSIGLVWLSRGTELFYKSQVALGLVIFQGLLGGLTVMLKISPFVSTLHLGTSQIFLGLLLYLVLQSRSQKLSEFKINNSDSYGKKIRFYLIATAALLYLQLLVGASIRHGGAGVACGLGSDSALLCQDAVSGNFTLWPSTLAARFHMLHRFLGIAVFTCVIAGTLPFMSWVKRGPGSTLLPSRVRKEIRLSLVACHTTVTIQVLLGIWTLVTHISPLAVTLHLVFAMLLWLCILKLVFDSKEIFVTKGLESRAQ